MADEWVQKVVVMRHGDRVDHAEPMWVAHAARPWDPPLTNTGLMRAWSTGRRLRAAGVPIHRVIVSPFLRCIQTAAEAVSALCATTGDHDPAALLALETSRGVTIDPSRVKVSIEYGLCEMLNRQAIGSRIQIPKDGKWFPDLSELESMLPAGTVDPSFERLYGKMPEWEEGILEARNRYASMIQALADKYPRENLLLVTHGEAVGASVSYFQKGLEIYEVDYCAYSHLERRIKAKPGEEFLPEKFRFLTQTGQTGIGYSILPEEKILYPAIYE